PLSLNGPVLTIRKFSVDPYTVEDLIGFGSITQGMAAFLAACVKVKLNIIVSGGTGSGKTTLLNVLSSFIPEGERIVTVEDAAELKLHQPHVVRLESRPPNIEGKGEIKIRDLVRNCLRMRPDRIIVGETEVQGMEGNVIVLQDLFVYQQKGVGEGGKVLGTMQATGMVPKFADRFNAAGVHLPTEIFKRQGDQR